MENKPIKTYKSIYYIFGFVLNACLGGFFFGYIMGELNLLLVDLKYQYKWDDSTYSLMRGLLNALLPIGAIIGTILAGNFFGKLGRKWSLILADILGVVGCVICLFLGSSGTTQIFGRLLTGIATGINSQIIPIYINELTPIEVSGAMGTFFQSFINVGILISYVMGLGIPDDDSNVSYDTDNAWWKFVFAFPIITSALRCILLITIFNFDTPFSLLKQEKPDEEVMKVMRRIYHEEHIEAILNNIKKKISDFKDVGYGQIFSQYTMRLFVGFLLMITQQFCGINAVVTDSSSLYEKGNSAQTVKILTIINSLVLAAASMISGKISDLYGRRTLLMLGTTVCGILLIIMGIMQQLSTNSAMDNASVAFTMIFLFSFGISLGPIAWVYAPEILPEKGVSIAVIANWLFCCLVVFLTPILIDHVGISPLYYFFGGCCFVSLIYMFPMLKETKGKSAVEIDKIFGNKSPQHDEFEEHEKVSNNNDATDPESNGAQPLLGKE